MKAINEREILSELNGSSFGPYISAYREDTILKGVKNAEKNKPRWFVVLHCPNCGEPEKRRLDYARRVAKEGRDHLCMGVLNMVGTSDLRSEL